MPYLLDTNVLTQLLRRTPAVVDRYRRALRSGEPVLLSTTRLFCYITNDRDLPPIPGLRILQLRDYLPRP